MTKTTTTTESNTVPKPRTPPVIFLDPDGVLVFPDGTWSMEAIQQLNRFCLEASAAAVLTTSCRYGCWLEELHKTLHANGLDKEIAVLGETRDLGRCRAAEKSGDLMFQCEFERWSKGREIAQWLNEHPGATRFVVVDDKLRLCAPYQKRTLVPVVAFSAPTPTRTRRCGQQRTGPRLPRRGRCGPKKRRQLATPKRARRVEAPSGWRRAPSSKKHPRSALTLLSTQRSAIG